MLTRIRRRLNAVWHYLISSRYRLVQRSGLFDPDHYLDINPDVAASGADPLAHYLNRGFAEPRQPATILFDHSFYLHQIPGLDRTIDDPLLHFLEKGRYQGHKPNLLVDPDYYAGANPDFDPDMTDPLTHFLKTGVKGSAISSPSPYFDGRFYCCTYADAAQLTDDPRAAYRHFLAVGVAGNRQPSIYFDMEFYLDRNSVLHEIRLDALNHYRRFGAGERKSPCPLFEPLFYEKKYHVAACNDLFAHFLAASLHEDRQPCSWFDPVFYRQTYLSEADASASPFKHFLETGQKAGHYPNETIALLAEKPLISVLVPVYNVGTSHLNNCIRSVLYQSYPHWELCLVDDCSTDTRLPQLLSQWAASDQRIKIDFLTQNAGISAATNAAAELASGSYLVFLDNDDELAPEALHRFVERINDDHAELYYTDESLIGEDGRHLSVFRKPSFNEELLLSHNYVTHCVMTRKSLFDHVGGCAGAFNGAQDHDLFLKLSEVAETIVHIPEILYHWRASKTSTSINHNQKQYADEAGRQSVEKALNRRDQAGEVLFTDLKFFYRAKRFVTADVSVTLVICWEKPEEQIIEWLTALLSSSGHRVSQLILLMTQQPAGTLVDAISSTTGINTMCTVITDDLGAAAKLNAARADITSELAGFVSGHLDIVADDWLAALVEYGQSSRFGIISGRIEYPPEYYDSLTSIPDSRAASPVYFNHFLTNCSVFMNGRHCQQEVLGVSSELFLLRNELLQSENGFDADHFPHLFAITDLSLRLHQRGWKNIYTPYCTATTRINDLTRHRQCPAESLQEEKIRFQNKWLELLDCGDPFYNPGVISDNKRSVAEYRKWLTGTQSPPL